MHYGFGGFGMILVWAALVGIAIVVVKALVGSSTSRRSGPAAPLEILKERYAAGEITRDEFGQKKRDLVAR